MMSRVSVTMWSIGFIVVRGLGLEDPKLLMTATYAYRNETSGLAGSPGL